MDLPSRKERRQSGKKTIKQKEKKIKNTKSSSHSYAPKKSFFKYLGLLFFLSINGFLIYTYNIFLLLFFAPAFFMFAFFFFHKSKKLLWINLFSTLIITIGILEVLYRQNFQ